MKKNSIRSFHFDYIYKCVPPTPNKYCLLVLFNFDNLFKKQFYAFLFCTHMTFANIF